MRRQLVAPTAPRPIRQGRVRWCLALRMVLSLPGIVHAAHAGATTVDDLLRMSPGQLEALYMASPPAPVPSGKVRGTPILRPGSALSRPISKGARAFWQGKVFRPAEAQAVNRFFGVRIIRGELYQAPSWLDGRPALILDYARTSHLYANYRDEIRQVAPGLYLGLMYDRTTCPPSRTMMFALEACP